MTFIDKTSPSETEAISFEVDLPYPPEKVWRALTDPGLLAEWLLPAVIAVSDAINEPRYPSLKGIMSAKSKPAETLTLADSALSP